MKIAVVGAGLFGVTTALKLQQFGDIHLFEKSGDILTAASRVNQLRLHRGYHYPRSPETVKELLASQASFLEEYHGVVLNDFSHYYCIAKSGSKVSGPEFLEFCRKNNLEFREDDYSYNTCPVDKDKIETIVNAKESLIDFWSLRNICLSRLNNSKVKVHYLTEFLPEDVEGFDYVINCTYASVNSIVPKELRRKYQFEVCEKIIVKPPPDLKNKSIVVMDGPFMCFDPLGNTGLSLMGNVVHAIRSSNVGMFPSIPKDLSSVLNSGPIRNPPNTAFKDFIQSASEFFPTAERCEHIASMFTVRAVLPNLDKTDARPTVVSRISPKIINMFSGKLDTCVNAANQVVKIINQDQSK